MNGHNVQLIKGPATVGALSHSIGDSIVDAAFAEYMPASLEHRVLEVCPANGTEGKFLEKQVSHSIQKIK